MNDDMISVGKNVNETKLVIAIQRTNNVEIKYQVQMLTHLLTEYDKYVGQE